MASPTQIVLLGTGNPNPDPDRAGPAVAIIANGQPYLIDCGSGIVRRAAAAARQGVPALAMPRLTKLFLTHLHSDHTVGYPDLIFTPWVIGRTSPLEVYGPPGTRTMTDHLHQAYAADIHVRLRGFERANPHGYQVQVHEIQTGLIYQDPNVRVRAFRVQHGSWRHAFGFRFETVDRTVVISGDTRPCRGILTHSRHCDVLIHEVYCQEAFDQLPRRWQKYHTSFHTSSRQLATLAKKLKPGKLILYHQLLWGATDAELLAEIRQEYPGPVISGKDLEVY